MDRSSLGKPCLPASVPKRSHPAPSRRPARPFPALGTSCLSMACSPMPCSMDMTKPRGVVRRSSYSPPALK